MTVAADPVGELLEIGSSSRKVNLNLSPYRDMSPTKRHLRKSTGPLNVVPNKPKSGMEDPSHFFWLYASLEFKMSYSEELALKKATKHIDRLVERLQKQGGEGAKGCILFDIVATKKHIVTGVPHKLGRAIYKYIEDHYFSEIATTFVGLTDNTARRVARDIYCRHKDLSKNKHAFDAVDGLHMFIVYPSVENREKDPTLATPGFIAANKYSTSPLPAVVGR